MLTRRFRPSCLSRCLHASQPLGSPDREIESCYKRLDMSFTNTEEAYRNKSSWELFRGVLVLRLCSIRVIVQNNREIIKWVRRVGGRTLLRMLMKATFYGHFVAGEDEQDIKPVVTRMRQYGVKSILDYSVEADISREEATEKGLESSERVASVPLVDHEKYKPQEEFMDRRQGVVSARTYFYQGEPECDRNMETFLKCIDQVAHATEGTGFIAIKLTALGRPQLLLQLSEVVAFTKQFYKIVTGSTWENVMHTQLSEEDFLRRLRDFGIRTDDAAVQKWFQHTDFNQDGFVDLYEWGRLIDQEIRLGELFTYLNLKTGKMEPLIKTLTEEEEVQFRNMMGRLNIIAERAVQTGVRVMIDAEQTYFQPAISRLTLELMRKYNKQSGVIFNTYQSYLKSALTNVRIDKHLARREKFHFGAKLVRGAYMEQERRRAAAVGYEDPINPTYQSTTDMYDNVLEEILEEWAERGPKEVSVMCATHNEDTVRHCIHLMRRFDIAPSARILCFGQLYGMCDQVSFSLGQAGFSVYKYVPYGPVEEVIPYLSRRATENSGVLGESQRERQLMGQELFRRFRGGDWWHGHRPGPFQTTFTPPTLT